MSRKLALLGASGHAKVVAEAALAAGWNEVVLFDDRWPESRAVGERAIVGSSRDLLESIAAFEGVIVSIGECRTRWEIHRRLRGSGASFATVVHPRAWVSPSAHLGGGTVVMAGAVVQADSVIGDACIVNTSCSVDHDCRLGDAVLIAPGARLSGDVTVGDRSWIGVGACIRQGIHIGRDVVVGAGAVVVKDWGDDVTLVGCPAAPIRGS